MNGIRKFLSLVTTVAVAIFAGPAFADSSQFVFSMQVVASPGYDATSGQVMAPVPITVTIKNESSTTNPGSNISSFSLTPVGVTIDPYAALTCPGAMCAVDAAHNTLLVTNMSPLKAGLAYPVTFSVSSCGDGKWTAAVWTGSQLSGSSFSRLIPDDPTFPYIDMTNVACGVVGCGPDQTFTVANSSSTSPTDPGSVWLQRGAYNKDGSCASTDYFVSNTIPQDATLHFRWPVATSDPLGQPYAAFLYAVNFAGIQVPVPQVAWLNTDGTPATSSDPTVVPAYVPAPACLSQNLPAPYGSLVAGITATSTQIQVDTSTPSTGRIAVPKKPPFPIVIGTERMLVTKAPGNNIWTVVRAQGGISPAMHQATNFVMSTPLPLLPAGAATPYTPGFQAQMCVAAPPTLNSGGFWTTLFIDIGDGYVKGSF